MKRHIYEYDEVVIGSNLSAILYAYVEQKPLLFKEYNPPFFYEYFDVDVPLENLFLSNKEDFLKTPQGEVKVGASKLEVYNRLLFILSLSGLIPLSDKIQNIRIEENNSLKISTERNRTVNVKYNKLRIFEPHLVSGIDQKCTTSRKKLVQDRIKYYAKEHPFDMILCEDDFINEIHFYKKVRTKECLVVSRLLKSELSDFDFSVIPLKYKLKHIFEINNIKKHNSERNIIIEFLNREVYNQDILEFEKKENIILDNRTEKNICQKTELRTTHSSLLDVYPWKLNHLLLDSNGMIR